MGRDMTPAEVRSYNAGVRAVLAIARATSAALAPAAVTRGTRIGFAMEALDALAQEGAALLLQPTSPPSRDDQA